MTRENIERALELAFEMEGLLCLMQKREDMTPYRVAELLRSKGSEFASLVGSEPLKCEEGEMRREERTEEKSIAQSALEEEAEDGAPAAVTPAPAAESAPASEPKRGIVFTLNDRFRFKRELFDDNQEEFDATIEIISGMESMDEVEDYLYNDLCLDADNEVVAEFAEALRSNF